METLRNYLLNCIAICFQLLLLLIFSNATATSHHLPITPPQSVSYPLKDVVCALLNCGQGTCMVSNASLLGYDCECHSGWKKPQFGSFTFPSCVIPNCTIDFHCDNGSRPPLPPPLPPPSALLIQPPINFSNLCGLVWCGDGTCVANVSSSAYTCQCHEGSANLFKSTNLACVKECYLGADCSGLGLINPPTPTPTTPPTSTKTPGSHKIRSSSIRNGSRSLHFLMIIMSAITVFLFI